MHLVEAKANRLSTQAGCFPYISRVSKMDFKACFETHCYCAEVLSVVGVDVVCPLKRPQIGRPPASMSKSHRALMHVFWVRSLAT